MIHRMALSRCFFLSTTLTIALAAGGCVGPRGSLNGRASDEWTRSYTLQDGGEFQIVGGAGTIEVTGGDGPTIEVKAERIVHAPTDAAAQPIPARIRIVDEVQPDSVVIRNEGVSGVIVGLQLEVNFHVTMPRSTRVHLRTASGDITVSNVAGAVVASAMNGSIAVKNASGALEARATNGNVAADLSALGKGTVELRSTNGNVALTLPATADANVDATATNGTIDIEGLPLESTGQGSRHRARGPLNNGGTLVQLVSTNGNVAIKAATR